MPHAFFSEMLCPARGLVIVTDDVAPAATPVSSNAEAAARTTATRHMPVFNADLLLDELDLGEGSLAARIPINRAK